MTTEKQKAIELAYLEIFKNENEPQSRFNEIKSFICENGWFSGSLFGVSEDLIDFSGHTERPKSLAGIENNLGWIKINSEKDLPKEIGNYWVIDKILHINPDKDFFDPEYLVCMKERWMHRISHYQPIQKPKPPIY